MATAKTPTDTGMSNRKRTLYVLLVIAVILAAVLAFNLSYIKGLLDVGTNYGARVACSCHYIGGRDLDDCSKDFEPGMEMIGLSLNEEARRITASVPFMESATAEFREGWGCVLLTDEEAEGE